MEVIEKVPSRRRRRLHASDESLSVQKKKKLDDIQRLELRIQFLSSETRRIEIDKKLSPPFSSVPTTSKSSSPPTPSPRAASIDSTHYRD